MILYIIIKLLLSYWLIIKKQGIKNQEKLFLFFDFIVIIIYLIVTYIKGFKLLFEILLFGIILVIIFLLYKGLNYIVKNNIIILEKIKKIIGEKKQKKIKSFFLKPKVCKIIYYFIGMLPGNIGYGIYFWIMENGGYARVGISSTRDIILGKIFKWDSRIFFYNLFEKMKKNYIYQTIIIIIGRLQGMIYRIMYLLYALRKMIIKIKIKKYIGIRIIVYMYLSIFYLYILMEIQYINKILFYLLIIMELLFLYYTKEIIEHYEKEFLEILKDTITEEIIGIINFLKYPFNIPYMQKGVKNKFIWDLTLSNSVSLNILYKYILFVNKNTKGYFDRQMNIMTRIYREKYLERKSILWDVLPRTRYVIISLKNESFYRSKIENLDPDFAFTKYASINVVNNKNLYLGYYEKTYSNTSLLMLIGILRINMFYGDFIDLNIFSNDKYMFYKLHSFCNFKDLSSFNIYVFIYLYIYKYDKRLINEEILFCDLLNENICYYNEEIYFYKNGLNIYENKHKLIISNKICGIKNYKKMFKIMGRIMLYEEDHIIGNNNLQQILNEFYFLKEKNKIIKEKYENLFNEIINNINNNSLTFPENFFDTRKKNLKKLLEINNEEIFNYQDFRLFFFKLILKNQELKIIKTGFDANNIEEILDILLYYQIKKNKMISQYTFYDKKNLKNFLNGKLDINFEEIKNYKK